ncbi:MAG: EscU/YscU/HrcU family type III secretion system export apparatus switch protein [Burkholderiaceae bacterium]|nr:EscU/YscU/HrcU family type III secretion system export apparatus switch protein [Burkholderiaceae bacterium]
MHQALETADQEPRDDDTSAGVRRAAALAYEVTDRRRGMAPRVSAKGSGLVADEIIARARAAGVPIHESRELVSLLMQVDLDQHIPPALYLAVAEVLAWVYRLESREHTRR